MTRKQRKALKLAQMLDDITGGKSEEAKKIRAANRKKELRRFKGK